MWTHSWFAPLLAAVCISLAYATTASASTTTFAVPQHWVHTNVLRTIGLQSPIVHESTSFVAQNVHSESIGEYYFPIPERANEHLALIDAKEKNTGRVFEVVKAEFDSQNRVQYYKVYLNRRIDPQEKITIIINVVLTHYLVPKPHEIAQTGRQYLIYDGNLYADIAYASEKQKTNVVLPSTTVLYHTDKPGLTNRVKTTITYGPFGRTEPSVHESLRVHYGYQRPVTTIRNMRRDLEVSHWGGNLAVEEHFNITHDGAKLKGQFSRLEFTLANSQRIETNMALEYSLMFPPGASDPYYRDEVGNVSTSHFRNDRDRSVFQFKPRYPLFGGWNYTWYHGYNLPLRDFLRYHAPSGRYILNVPFIQQFTGATFDNVQVRIILPEGASNVKVEVPFPVDKEKHATHKTYLDTTGRYVVVLEKHNLVEEHAQNFQVSYTYGINELLQKPLAAAIFFLCGFALSMVYSRMEITIGQKVV